jgi:predicted DCC family thiol-disulfide oxidoreductase YuxK
VEKNNKAILMVFDGECALCHAGVQFLAKRTSPKKLPIYFIASTSEAGDYLLREAGHDPQNLTSIVVYSADRFYVRSNAIAISLTSCRILWQIFGVLLYMTPNLISDFFYDLVARNRKKIFKNNSCELNPSIQKMSLITRKELNEYYP